LKTIWNSIFCPVAIIVIEVDSYVLVAFLNKIFVKKVCHPIDPVDFPVAPAGFQGLGWAIMAFRSPCCVWISSEAMDKYDTTRMA